MNILIIKLGATGDVVRTTPLLRHFKGSVTWLTTAKNSLLLDSLADNLRHFSWEARARVLDISYDLAINLEDTLEPAQFLRSVGLTEIFGAYAESSERLCYTANSKDWFDLSLISSYGKLKADKLKFQNRQTYQEMIFAGLGLHFAGEQYLLPEPLETGLSGDVAIAADAGHVWPMKKWAYYGKLKEALEERGLTVNILPERRSVLEEFFYKRGYDERATTAISVDQVFNAVIAQLEATAPAANSAMVR